MIRHCLAALIFLGAGVAAADETVPICYGYGCIAQAQVKFSDAQLAEIGRQLSVAVDAEIERKLLAVAIGELYGWAGQQSDIRNDRGGNYADGHASGKMDCIDHSQSTTRLLRLLEARGLLRWHRVQEPEVRNWALVFPAHWSAVIEEKRTDGEKKDGEAARFVVDSWFVDNGQPAVILPLAEWKEGRGPMSEKTVVVGLSGGVDSSVAALLLKRQGWKVLGLFMKNWEDDDTEEYCSSRQDLIDVMSVADRIGIDVEVVNFAAEYRERVFAEFLREYQAGRTPNPDILCNSEIKFKAFLDYALKLGAEKIATGHYAGVREFEGEFQLLKAEDGTKDQSYFLYRLNQAQLSKTLFPLAGLYKREVRKIAEAEGLHVAAKKDSTGICFIGERPFKDFLSRYLPPKQGEIRRLDDGKVLGQHDGLMYHTLGQRKGLHIGGLKEKGQPGGGDHDAWFVAGKDMEKNVLYVVQGHDHPALFRSSLVAEQLSWVSPRAPHTHWVYTAKPRYRTDEQACEIERIDAASCEIDFAEPQWALTPGQSVVLYESRVCLGGGVIR